MTRITSFNGYRPIRQIATPTCNACQGSTIGQHGEQCRRCEGKGFLVRGGCLPDKRAYFDTKRSQVR